jgi:hypothetical protein
MSHFAPARLHVLLARESSAAVVIRRGPSHYTAVIGWDRATDQFTPGQWLHGRIYECNSDLSPDGRHLIYFARRRRYDIKRRTDANPWTWTAISKAPYLKALTFYASRLWLYGGGLFVSSHEYWLNDGLHKLYDKSCLIQIQTYPWSEPCNNSEYFGIYHIRLQRDGWTKQPIARGSTDERFAVFEKPVDAHWLLRKIAYSTSKSQTGKGHYFDEYELWNMCTCGTIGCANSGPRSMATGLCGCKMASCLLLISVPGGWVR